MNPRTIMRPTQQIYLPLSTKAMYDTICIYGVHGWHHKFFDHVIRFYSPDGRWVDQFDNKVGHYYRVEKENEGKLLISIKEKDMCDETIQVVAGFVKGYKNNMDARPYINLNIVQNFHVEHTNEGYAIYAETEDTNSRISKFFNSASSAQAELDHFMQCCIAREKM